MVLDEGWRGDLERWLKPFLAGLSHPARRRMCPRYIAGLIGPSDRKSVQPMAARGGNAGYDQLHHFVAAGVWDSAPLEAALLSEADRLVGGTDAFLVIDDTAMPKKGRHSVGVAPQYASSLGKNANYQTMVSVTLDARGHQGDASAKPAHLVPRLRSSMHRLTEPRHSWTNGQVERMNRTIKDATVKRYYYDSHDQLRQHLGDFVTAYNFGRRLKTLRGLTPYEAICKAWADAPASFTSDPHHQTPDQTFRAVFDQPASYPQAAKYFVHSLGE